MNEAESIIEKFGGQSALAKILETTQSTVQYWAQTGRIPFKWHGKILEIARERGLSIAAPIQTPSFFVDNAPVVSGRLVEEPVRNTKLYAINYGMMRIAGREIPCAVLNNRKRVIIQREIVGLLTGNIKGGFDRYFRAENLQPYVPLKFAGRRLEESVFTFTHKKNTAQGFEGTDLIDICEMYLKARKDGVLLEHQQALATQAEIIVRSFAKLGVVAAIDEVTGYKKESDEYQKLLQKYIAEELQPWVKTFGEDFYYQIYRLKGWNWGRYAVEGKNHPWEVAKITNRIVYEKLPEGVLEELRKKNPKNESGNRKHRMFQFLNPSQGYVHLLKHLGFVQAVLEKHPDGNWLVALHEIDTRFPSLRDPWGQRLLDLNN